MLFFFSSTGKYWVHWRAPSISGSTIAFAVMGDAKVRARLDTLGAVPMRSTPEEYARFIRSEMDKFAKLVRDAGIPQE